MVVGSKWVRLEVPAPESRMLICRSAMVQQRMRSVAMRVPGLRTLLLSSSSSYKTIVSTTGAA
jgi:hypothetical protein